MADNFIQFSKLDPFASFLGMAADVHDIMSRVDQGTRESLAVSLSVALANNVSNKTYLKGLTLTASDQTSDPVRQEIARLAGSSAGKAFLPVPHKDGNISLLDWQNAKGQTAYDRLMELHGETKIGGKSLHDRMGDLIKSDLYQQKLHDGTELYPNSKRVELVNNLRATYRQVAMQQLLKEFPDIAKAVRVDQVNRAKAAVYGKAGVQPLPIPGAVQASNPFARLYIATEIAKAGGQDVQATLMQAYEDGTLRGDQFIRVRQLVDRRRALGKGFNTVGKKTPKELSAKNLLRTYQAEVRRQTLMVKKAEMAEQRLVFVLSALRKGFLGKLLANDETSIHLDKHHGDLMMGLRKVIETVAADMSSLPTE